jgi:hypothetical protein
MLILKRALAFGHHEDRTPTHGYERTRKAAMALFARKFGNGSSSFYKFGRLQSIRGHAFETKMVTIS